MTQGDRVRVSVRVDRPLDVVFRRFTEDIDRWWIRSPAYRAAGRRPSVITLEPELGGALRETVEAPHHRYEVQFGTVIEWSPPRRLALEWRNVNFAEGELTWVEVDFEPMGEAATLITVTHRGWAALRPDHPARHGQAPAAFQRAMGRWWANLLTSLRER